MQTIRFKLLLGFAIIIFFSQVISALTIWHESIEHIDIMLSTEIDAIDKDQKVKHEIREIILSIILITASSLFISFLVVYTLITQLTAPLEKLIKQLQDKRTQHFKLIEVETPAGEITQVKETINALLAQLKSRFQQERQFTSDVAHELRTPLAGLRLHLELMAKRDPSVLKLIAKIDGMMHSISLLFQLARTEERFLTGQLVEVDLIHDLIIPLKQEYESQHEDTKYYQLEWIYPKHIRAKLDVGLLLIALKNLIDNAIIHGGDMTLIEVKLSQSKDHLYFEVIDNGMGVESDKLDRLCLLYERVDLNHAKSWGVGLNLVKRIVLSHMGEFEIKNRIDNQTGLHVTIKIKIA